MSSTRRLRGLLLGAIAGALAWASAAAGLPVADLAALEAVRPLRLTDPPAFIAAVERLDAAPEPADATARQALDLLRAHALALQGRFDDALRTTERLHAEGGTPALRIQAGALGVNLQARRGDYLAAQRRLEGLLAESAAQPDAGLSRNVDLVAAIYYNQLAQHEPARRHAEAVLGAGPDATERCAATVQLLEATVASTPHTLDDGRFAEALAQCEAAGGRLLAAFLNVSQARWLGETGRHGEAVSLLEARLDAITATGHPRLMGEAYARFAEALQRTGRFADAEAMADLALSTSLELPTGLPLLIARRTRYAVAAERGDPARALAELQAVIAAERAYAEEVKRMQAAYEAGRGETAEHQLATALLEEANKRLQLEARRAKYAARTFQLLAGLAALGLAALVVKGWRARARRRRLLTQLKFDALTGLLTRQHFTEGAAAALAAAARRAQPMALVLIDLDHFSRINARFGHLSGDALLEAVGIALRRLENDERSFGRLGGEELAILLPRSGLDDGLGFAERCRAAIDALRVPTVDGSAAMTVTASFGVVSTAAAGYRLRDLLASADEALYRAKSAGRNRVAAALVAAALLAAPGVQSATAAASDYARGPGELVARFDADGDGRVVEQEYVDYLARGFLARDVDGNGRLEGDELPPGSKPLTREDNAARLRRQFTRQDANRDGWLDARELLAPPRG